MTTLALTHYLRLLILSVMLGTASLAFAATVDEKTTIEDVRQETRDLIQSLKSYTVDQRSKAIQEVELAILRLDNRIDDLESRIDRGWDNMTTSAREEARAALRDLRRQRVQLAEAIGGLKNSTANAWTDLKQGFSKAYENINRSWEKALREFGPDQQNGG